MLIVFLVGVERREKEGLVTLAQRVYTTVKKKLGQVPPKAIARATLRSNTRRST